MKIIDISLPLNNHTPVYPGNVPLDVSMHHAMPEHATALSKIIFGSHTGTHIDAPGHAILGAPMLDQIPLETFMGPCRVLDFSLESAESVTKEMIEKKLSTPSRKRDTPQEGNQSRILLKTRNSLRGFKEFYDDYVYLDGDAAEYLASVGVMLVGIDALSIKKRGSTDHRPHTSLLSKNIPIIEGLNLANVAEGEYQLVCLPLNFTGIDGSPARAVLIDRM